MLNAKDRKSLPSMGRRKRQGMWIGNNNIIWWVLWWEKQRERGCGNGGDPFIPVGSQAYIPEAWRMFPERCFLFPEVSLSKLGKAIGIGKRVWAKEQTVVWNNNFMFGVFLFIIMSSWDGRGLLDQNVWDWRGQSMRLEMLNKFFPDESLSQLS